MLNRWFAFLALASIAAISPAAVVSDFTPNNLSGTAVGSADFLGVVTIGGTGTGLTIDTSPTTTAVSLNEALGTIEANDVVGRDLNGLPGFGSSTVLWSYRVDLPGTADAGTGLTNIAFNADLLFSDAAMNSVSSDSANRLTFELFLNGTTSGSVTHVAPVDMEGAISSLTNVGGATITSAEVRVFTTNASAFDAGTESFAVTNASLTADFEVAAVPEPSSLAMLAFSAIGIVLRRRR
jgi:hypothetical protein